jgi:rhodanese-related sulfurtransferase
VTARRVDDLLAEARSRLERLSPAEAHGAEGVVLVDIRSESQRKRHGVVPGSRYVPRNVLEWKLDPSSEYRDPELARGDVRIVLMCQDGYQSSLAAATLQQLGHDDATDLIGGFTAWREAGLPVESGNT